MTLFSVNVYPNATIKYSTSALEHSFMNSNILKLPKIENAN